MRVQGEFEFPVPPLALPELGQLPEPAALLQYGAVALFVQRAQAITREFAVTRENAIFSTAPSACRVAANARRGEKVLIKRPARPESG